MWALTSTGETLSRETEPDTRIGKMTEKAKWRRGNSWDGTTSHSAHGHQDTPGGHMIQMYLNTQVWVEKESK